jgi:2'-5' RNA ligase
MERNTRHRLFLALWPTPEFRRQIAAGVQGWLGDQSSHAQRPDQWHTTLVFIGYVDPIVVEAVEDLAGSVACEPFALPSSKLRSMPQVSVTSGDRTARTSRSHARSHGLPGRARSRRSSGKSTTSR